MDKVSKSERFVFGRRGVLNAPSVNAAKSISSFRKNEIAKDIERGVFLEGSSQQYNKETEPFNLGVAALCKTSKGIERDIEKKAALGINGSGSSNGTAWGGSGGTIRQGPEIYSPLWLTSNTHLPRDRGTMNAWARAYFALNPIVNNALSLHSTYPISKLNIVCSDKRIEDFFNTMAEEMDLLNVCVQMAQEYFVIGEVFPLLDLDESTMKWKRCIIQNPDFIHVKRTAIPTEPEISLKPDDELKRVVSNNDAESKRVRASLPPEIIKYVKAGKNIPLDNFYISHLARKISPYETRGTSIIASCFKALMLWDKLRECKYAQADNLINPITLVKLGGSSDAEYKVTQGDLENWRQLLAEAQYDKDFKIITHGSVTIERVGAQTVIDINADLEKLIKEIYIGLMVPQVIMEGGDITYANGSLSLDVLRQRYMQFQNMIAKWIRTKVFAPIAQLHDFWDYSDGEKKLIVPNIEWNHMNLFDMSDYITQLSQLVGEKKMVSIHTLYRSLGLDYEEEQRKIRQESIDEAIKIKEEDVLSRLSLTELRALDEDEDIPDLPDIPVPGESPDETGGAAEGGEERGITGGMGGGIPAPPTGGGVEMGEE
jgi:hypothetical protein